MKLHCFVSVLSVFCNSAMWFSGLHLVVLFFLFFFFVFLCSMFVFLLFFIPLQKKNQNRTQQPPPPKKKCWKQTQKYNSGSAVVFTNSVPDVLGGATKLHFPETP